jgi:4-amino-4-deoxy-L-arabinose transferase-like glycosyltransferase
MQVRAARVTRNVVRRTWLGLAIVAASGVGAFAVTRMWDASGTGLGWRTTTLAFLVLGVMAVALIEELGRPQNPYKNIDPRFSYLDAGPTGQLTSASSAWLWHAIPPAVVAALILLSLFLR